MKMGTISSGKILYRVNEKFFKVWTSQMAYILGFTCADGNVYGRSLGWDLTDKYISNFELLKSFNVAMSSDYPIMKRSNSFRLRISNRKILDNIKKLGIIPNKKKVLVFPSVPKKYLNHFIRGFLDGDGWIISRIRKNKGREICVGFSNGSYDFMNKLVMLFAEKFEFRNCNLRKRKKKMKNGDFSVCYQLEFYSEKARKILDFLYGGLSDKDLILGRKYEKMIEAISNYEYKKRNKKLGYRFVNADFDFNGNIEMAIKKMLNEKNMIPREVAEKIGVSLSSLYRFMDRFNIRKLEKRGSSEWNKKILKSRRIVENYGKKGIT